MGPAGAGSLAQVVNAAVAGKSRMDEMNAFFAGVGTETTAGVWEDVPRDRPEFRARFAQRLKAEKKKTEEPV